jgi:hypothetical protein
VAPHPRADPPPETDPRQVSNPAAVRPGANTFGTLVIDSCAFVVTVAAVVAGEELLIVRLDLALGFETALLVAFPPVAFPPPIATAPDVEVELDMPVPTPIPVAV